MLGHADYLHLIFPFFYYDEISTFRTVNKHWKILTHSFIRRLISGCASGDFDKEFKSTVMFRKWLSIERNPPIQMVIDFGIVPRFIEFLQRPLGNSMLVFEAAWVLTNIASGSVSQTQFVVDCGAVPRFIRLMEHDDDQIKEQAVWALGNIAGNGIENRDLLIESGIMKYLLEFGASKSLKSSLIKQAIWTLSNLWRLKPRLERPWVAPSLQVLVRLLHSFDAEILEETCATISYITDDNTDNNERIEAFIRTGSCRRMVELMGHSSKNVRTFALRTVGNVVTGNDRQTQAMINAGALRGLETVIRQSKDTKELKEACWTISNITAGTQDQIQSAINAEIFPPLIELLNNGEFDVKKEIIWVIANAFSGGSPEQIEYIVSLSCIPALFNFLSICDAKIIETCLDAILSLVQIGNPKYIDQMKSIEGSEKLKSLEFRAEFSVQVSSRVARIAASLLRK
jgi:hypothetical protein